MPDLFHALADADAGYLRIIAELWGIELRPGSTRALGDELRAVITDTALATEVLGALRPDTRAALQTLIDAGGRLPVPQFTRKAGEIRVMGPGRRDREKPHLHTASPAEELFYRGLIAKAFLDTDNGLVEFTYIPDEFLRLFAGQRIDPVATVLGRPAVAPADEHIHPATDDILDEATTYLAAVRCGMQPPHDLFLAALLQASGLIKGTSVQSAPARVFLEQPRRDALEALLNAWKQSRELSELRTMPDLQCEGSWLEDALHTRNFLRESVAALPVNTWWSMESFVQDIKRMRPDFQRRAGDYDSWFIRRRSDGRYLRGFGDWDVVDGELIRFLIGKVMYRLGLIDLAVDADERCVAFKRAPVGSIPAHAENARVRINSRAMITMPKWAPRALRYQISRFCEWDASRQTEFRYHLNARSLARAAQQGLKAEALLPVLARAAGAELPPPVIKSICRWQRNGSEAKISTQTVLRVSKPEILRALRSSRAGRFVGDVLGPTTVTIKAGSGARVLEALAELGVLGEDEATPGTQPT